MERLPLFPLNTVLIPGTVLPLHIFEPRYQTMIRDVLASSRRFGVLLYRPEIDEEHGVHMHLVGTVAEVTDVVPLGDGRLNISTTGRRRFRVSEFHHDRPYLSGDVEYLSDEFTVTDRLSALRAEVEAASLCYVTTILTLSNEQATQVRLPDDPVQLSYKVVGLLQAMLQPHDVQGLLESQSVERRLYEELLVLRKELAILRRMGEMRETGTGPSPN